MHEIVVASPQAIKSYKAELAKYGMVDKADEELLKAAQKVIDDSQLTTLESHLCRSLRKPEGERAGSCQKYLGLFAKVPPSTVQPQLMERAQSLRK